MMMEPKWSSISQIFVPIHILYGYPANAVLYQKITSKQNPWLVFAHVLLLKIIFDNCSENLKIEKFVPVINKKLSSETGNIRGNRKQLRISSAASL